MHRDRLRDRDIRNLRLLQALLAVAAEEDRLAGDKEQHSHQDVDTS